MNELVGLILGLLLTLFIYSYVVGDNPLYQLAVHILVGVSAAYAALVVLRDVVAPVLQQLQRGGSTANLLWLVPLLLALLLLLRRLPALAWLGNSSLALLVGVGSAVALMGAIAGTLLPQLLAGQSQAPFLNLLVALLTIATLLTFHFSGRRNQVGEWQRPVWQRGVAQVGQLVLAVTFGAIFVNVFSTTLVLLSNRLLYLLNLFTELTP